MIEKYQQIVAMLHDLTDEGKVEWEKTSSSEYKVSIGSSSISILYHEASPNSYLVNSTPDVTYLRLLLWNQNGELIDDVKEEERDYGSTDYDNLMSLYTAARRQYGKVYVTLDTIISDLTKATKEE
jgi:hypothetical protein